MQSNTHEHIHVTSMDISKLDLPLFFFNLRIKLFVLYQNYFIFDMLHFIVFKTMEIAKGRTPISFKKE
jgi:hypothetical protein